MTEIELKLAQVRALLAARDLDAILVDRVDNFAWLTGGGSSYINTATDMGAAGLLITRDAQYVVTSVIEAPRLEADEGLKVRGFQFLQGPWHAGNEALAAAVEGRRLGADTARPGAVNLAAELAALRLATVPEEVARYRELGQMCAGAMDAAIRAVRPGMTEFQIAGLLSKETYDRGALPVVNLIATDERIYRFRHPLPTGKTLERYAMLVLCGRKNGLVVSVTRLVHFGKLPAELRRKAEACAVIDATFIARTRPGARLGDVFRAATEAYAAGGYPNEWQLHHQGGPAGYNPREFVATFVTDKIVAEHQAYAWNPSITGVKSEDTILVGAAANTVLTAIPGWPMLEAKADGAVWHRPAILEVV